MFDPAMMGAMFGQGDPMGMAGIFAQAAQDPQLQQQLIPMLAASGMEPPSDKGPEQPSPFFDMAASDSTLDTPPMGAQGQSLNDPGLRIGLPKGPIPTPQPPAAPLLPDYGKTPTSPGMGEFTMPTDPNAVAAPAANPFATPGVFAGIPGAAPTPPGAAMAPAGAPPAPMASSLPFPTPTGDAGGNPFPTPIGSPAGGPTPAKPDMATLGKMLQGVKAPAAPEAQRVSTPSAPQPRGIDQNSPLSQMIAKLLMGGGGDPVAQLRLSQALK